MSSDVSDDLSESSVDSTMERITAMIDEACPPGSLDLSGPLSAPHDEQLTTSYPSPVPSPVQGDLHNDIDSTDDQQTTQPQAPNIVPFVNERPKSPTPTRRERKLKRACGRNNIPRFDKA